MPPESVRPAPWDQVGSAPALSGVADSPTTADAAALPMPERRYEAERLLGAGGMGVVGVSHDALLDRDVARKSVRPDLASDQRRQRLLREARIAARLEHPAIVPVYDAGVGSDGEPWYAMRLVRGQTLQTAIDSRPQLSERLGLMRHFLAACEGMAYAHARGIVHRDLKPDNVLVGELGETQIADWGLARVLADPEDAPLEAPSGEGNWTQAGTLLGTPQFASPEAARGEVVDTRGDVWSLGAVLWTLLSGQRPWHGEPLAQVMQHAREGKALPAVADAPPELLAVVQRATAAHANERYPTARELAEEVARWLDGRRVLAHTYSPRELLLRAIRAWRWQLAAAALALVAIGVASAVATVRVLAERNRAVAAEQAASEALRASRQSEATLLLSEAREAAADARWPAVDLLAHAALSKADSAEARGLIASAAGWVAPKRVQQESLPSCPRWLLPAADILLCVRDATTERWLPGKHAPEWTAPLAAAHAVVLPSGTQIQLLSRDGELRGYALQDGTQRVADHIQASARQAVALDDETLLATGGVGMLRSDLVRGGTVAEALHARDVAASPPQVRGLASLPSHGLAALVLDDELQLWRDRGALRSAVQLDSRVIGSSVSGIVLSPDGQALALGTTTGMVQIIGLDGRLRSEARVGSSMVRELHWQKQLLAVRDDAAQIVWFETEPLQRVVSWPLAANAGLHLANDGSWTQASDALRRWVWPSDLTLAVRDIGQGSGLSTLSAGPGWLLAPGADGWVSALHGSTGRPTQRWVLERAVVKAALYADNMRVLAVADPGGWGTLLLDPRGAAPQRRIGGSRIRRLGVLRDTAGGEILLSASMGELVSAVDLPSGATRAVAPASMGDWADLGVGNRGSSAVGIDANTGRIVVWAAGAPGTPLTERVMASIAGAAVAAMHPFEATVAVASGASWWQVDAASPLTREPVTASSRVLDLQWSSDGKFVAAAELDGRVEVWSWPERVLVLSATGHTQRAAGVAWQPDSHVLWSASWDGTVRRWDVDAGLAARPDGLANREAVWGVPWTGELPAAAGPAR